MSFDPNLNEKGPSMDEYKTLKGLVLGVMFVLATIVMGFVLDYWAKQHDSYENLVNQISEQGTKIDILTSKIEELDRPQQFNLKLSQ